MFGVLFMLPPLADCLKLHEIAVGVNEALLKAVRWHVELGDNFACAKKQRRLFFHIGSVLGSFIVSVRSGAS